MRVTKVAQFFRASNPPGVKFLLNFAGRYPIFVEALAAVVCLELGIWKLMIRLLSCSNAATAGHRIRFGPSVSN